MQEKQKRSARAKSVIARFVTLLVPLLLIVVLLSQTAFAQNTYVITDGETVVVHKSSATDPATILDEAGLSLGEDDTYTTSPGYGISEITVQRSETEPTDDLRMGPEGTFQSTQTYTVSIPAEVRRVNDRALPAGTEATVTEAVDGQMLCTATVTYENGIEVSRTVHSQTVIQQPTNGLVAVGVGNAPTASDEVVIKDGHIILPTGEILTYSSTMHAVATAYTHTEPGCDMWTATLTEVRVGTVAVDPTVIPYGTRMFIVTDDGQYIYGVGTAEDCGSAIVNNRIDLYYPTQQEVDLFGVRNATIYFLAPEQ